MAAGYASIATGGLYRHPHVVTLVEDPANQVLTDAIGKGFRGAYWDILRRCGGS
jgi:membrane peptidoglycan carboxypeptidase